MYKFITSYDKYSIWQLSEKGIMELAEFVVWENYKHHTGGQLNNDFHSGEVVTCGKEQNKWAGMRIVK